VLCVIVVHNPGFVLFWAARRQHDGGAHHIGSKLLLELVQTHHIASFIGASGGGVCPHIGHPAVLQMYVSSLACCMICNLL
jgi:hypothetical protein